MRDPNSFLRPLVTNESTVRLPRWVLLSLILAYSISGFVGHEPWKGPEALAFGRALDWLAGSAHWPVDVNVAHMASGLSIEAFASIFGVSTASRIPHMLALLATFAGVWYATFHLAKREQAQPALLPFGGQPHPVDYARCVADAAALGLIACLGLLGRGHEGVPEVLQMASVAVLLYGLAAASHVNLKGVVAIIAALTMQALAGTPIQALVIALVSIALGLIHHAPRVVLSAAAALVPIVAMISLEGDIGRSERSLVAAAGSLINLALWFWWPLWLISGYGLWLRRRDVADWGLAAPVALLAVLAGSAWLAGGTDLTLLPSLPVLAVLAGLNLPYLRRPQLALMDWFAVALCGIGAVTLWLIWTAGQFEWPAAITRNIDKLYPGVRETESWPLSLPVAMLAVGLTLAWLASVVWRTHRLRHPLWKGMVLSAGGVTLCWLLLQTLGSPLLHYSRSFKPIADSIAADVPAGNCVASVGLGDSQYVLLRHLSQRDLRSAADEACAYALVQHGALQSARHFLAEGEWALAWTGRRASDRNEVFSLFRRRR